MAERPDQREKARKRENERYALGLSSHYRVNPSRIPPALRD
jgi:hypothetical protein